MKTGRNITFPIKNADGTAFHDLVLRKATVESVVMSLGDKITGDVYYGDNSLAVTMQEYVEYRRTDAEDAVRYVLVSPPTIVREGLTADNGDLCGMTKYTFTFYHPMYMLGNLPFTDVAVSEDERRFKSEDRKFSWSGTGYNFIAKINKNLEGTQWVAVASGDAGAAESLTKLPDEIAPAKAGKDPGSPVLSFDDATVADACKTVYDTWKTPFVIDSLHAGEYSDATHTDYYAQGKRFVIVFGLPSNDIMDARGEVFVFRFGKGVGLKNNSRTPRNNKIVTRIAGYGSEDNIPYGYPQIVWEGASGQSFTYGDHAGVYENVTIDGHTYEKVVSYPIYKGIVGGRYVELVKHPFTRDHLMPSVYTERVNRKVNPYAVGYDPDTELIDYYDADGSYPNPMAQDAPGYESKGFDGIRPQLGGASIVSAVPFNGSTPYGESYFASRQAFMSYVAVLEVRSVNENERAALMRLYAAVYANLTKYTDSNKGGSYTFSCLLHCDEYYMYVKYTSDNANIDTKVVRGAQPPVEWDDTMDDEGKYVQSYFTLTLPVLSFDLYASAAITQEMSVTMRSGACIGCVFPVQVDWEDYKRNFYDADGAFDPVIGEGHPRDGDKYPDSRRRQIEVIVQKDNDTFGTLKPNIYQQPHAGDTFAILGISLPLSYIAQAEGELDDAMREYMLENNVHYFDYPLKFDEYFLANNTDILSQIRNNTSVRFVFDNQKLTLYVKQITVKYGENVLPQYDITLTDDVDVVLSKIGQTADDVSRMRVQVSELQKYYSQNLIDEISARLSRVADDVAEGRITFQQGLDAVGPAIFRDEVRSADYEGGLYDGRGWRIDQLGNAEFESAKIRSYLQIVELMVNRLQAQEGDTLYSDNDQIDKVDRYVDETDGSVSYVLSLKEKWEGYITAQMYGNVIKGKINTLAARQAGVSGIEDADTVETDGSNTYFTSWMRVIGTHNTDNTLGVNQIRVTLYGDNETPAQRNFEPCQLMNIARWGCVDYSDPDDPDYDEIKASIVRRQRLFMISTAEGRVVKYTGVDSPILRNGNYGVTIGELPDFVKRYRSVAERIVEGGDYLYAQGVVVGDFIKISKEGLPIPTVVYCGQWVKGDAQGVTPAVGAGIYLYNEYNEDAQQYEIHRVTNNANEWQCLQHQPVVSGGRTTYYEPKWNSPYWQLVSGNENLTIEFVSSKGYSFRRGAVDTVITPHLFYGNVDITDDVAEEYWTWTRESESGKTQADYTWDAQHQHTKQVHLTNIDMPASWSSADKAIFTCSVTVNDGKTTRTVDNQIIS